MQVHRLVHWILERVVVRSLAICTVVKKVISKAEVNIERDNDEKERCYLLQHKATEKPFDIISFKP